MISPALLDKLQLAVNVIIICSLFCHLSHEANIVFKEEPKDVLVMFGESTEFNCSARSVNPYKSPIYFWKFNGKYISRHPKNGFFNYGRTLIIENVNKSLHEGKYECMAFMEEYGVIISMPAYLRVAYFSVSDEYNSSYTVKDTASLFIKAPTITALPEPIFEWMYFDKQKGMFIHVNMDDAYLTKNGDLVFPSISKKYNSQLKLVVTHLTFPAGQKTVANISVQVKGLSPNCQDPGVVFPMQEASRVVNEGQKVVLECIGVARMCKEKREVSWLYKNIAYSGKHVIYSIRKQNEGLYTCISKIGSRAQVSYNVSLIVRGKPQIMVPIPLDITVTARIQLSHGHVLNADRTEWYANGEKITEATGVFKITSNNKLDFVRPSRSQTGIYQIFYSNAAGLVVQTINVYVETGNGKRVSGTSGNVTFVPVNAPSGLQHGSWLIQIPSVETVYLSLVNPPSCDKDDITQLSVFQGSTANGVRVDRICKSDSFKPVLLALKGPFVTLILVTAQLQQSGFFIRFDVNRAGLLTTTRTPTTTQQRTSTTQRRPSTSPSTLGGSSTTTSFKTATSRADETTSRAQTSVVTSSLPTGGTGEKVAGDDPPIGAIVGGICGAILIVAVLLGVFCYRRRTNKSATQNQAAIQLEKGGGQDMPRNTYMMRRPGTDLSTPRFTVQPNGRPMPDVIPSYEAVDGKYEMGYLGQDQTDSGNETYETVGDLLGRTDIGNLAYQPGRAPKQVIGRRIASGPGKNTDPNVIRPELSPTQPGQEFQEETYDSVADDSDYLTPVDSRGRIKSMAGRPLPSPTDSTSSGPVYQTLERDGSPVPGGTYESPHDVINNMKKFDDLERVPSNLSEDRYQALEEKEEPNKQNGFYEALTLERNAKPSPGIPEVNQTREDVIDSENKNSSVNANSEYSDPYDSLADQRAAGAPEETGGNNNHISLEERASDAYESLKGTNGTEDYQTLTLPRSAYLHDDDDDNYAAI